MKTGFERSVEMMTWAAVFIWIGFVLIMQLWHYPWVVFLALGIILLSSAVYQRARGWHTSLFIWISGIWMAVFSVMEVVRELVGAISGEAWAISWVVYAGITLISLGIAVVFRSVSFGGAGGGDQYSNPASARRRTTSTKREPQIPRQITTDDRSSGWAAPEEQARPRTSQRAQPRVEQPRVEQQLPPVERTRTQAQPQEDVSDLENRVEDIIRRSREKRDRGNLPY